MGADGLVSNLFILERQQRKKPTDKKVDIQVKDYMSGKLAMYLQKPSKDLPQKNNEKKKKNSPRKENNLQSKSHNCGLKQAIFTFADPLPVSCRLWEGLRCPNLAA